MGAVRKGLDNAIARVGYDPHGERHGRPHTGAQDSQQQHYKAQGEPVGPARRSGGKIREKGAEQVEKPGEYQTQRNLQHVHQQYKAVIGFGVLLPLNAVQDQLGQHKHTVKKHGGVAEVQLKDLGNAVGN